MTQEEKTREHRRDKALSLPPMSRGMRGFTLAVLVIVGGALIWFVLFNPLDLAFLPERGAETSPVQAGPVTLYQCPMHPEVIEEQPGQCPICNMELVAMNQPAGPTEGERDEVDHSDPNIVRIDPIQVQNIGVASEAVRQGPLARKVNTLGILDFNAELITWVNTKFAGWIEKAHVTYVGQRVREGDPLFEIYSPELVTTQEEYLRALDYVASLRNSDRAEARRQAESLLQSARARLDYWDVREDQIDHLESAGKVQRRLTVFSPVNGLVAEVLDDSLEGMYVEAGKNLYKIADLSTAWVHADVYESDLLWIREKQPAEVSFRFDPGRVIEGEILFLYPEVSEETRTLKICIEVPNHDGRLRAGMYADVVLHGPMIPDAVLIPNSSVLRSGERDLVFVDHGDGRFEPREVRTGIRGDGDTVEVLDGLTPGEIVVTQAQFMLDSESRVQEAIAKFRGRKVSERKP